MASWIVAVVLAVLIIVVVPASLEHPALMDAIQRHVRQSWVLGVLIAVIVSSCAVRRFPKLLRYWRLWAVIAGYLVLHFSLAVPALGRLGTISSGHIEELYIFLLAFCEIVVINFVLRHVTAPLPK